MKREVEKFPYGTVQGLSEDEARANFVKFSKKYGPTAFRIGLFILLTSTSAFATDGAPAPAPGSNQCAPAPNPNPSAPNVLPATKELVGIAAVGLVCAAAAAAPVTGMGIAACLLTIAAKACNKL